MTRHVLLVGLLVALGCGGGNRRSGDGGAAPTDTGPSPDGAVFVDCDERARWVYLVDSGRQLVRFQPDDLSLTPIGTVDCMAEAGATPFSMSVDRTATAWVLHQDHRLYFVSTIDASCTASSFARDQAGFELFGMGFAADGEGATEETLFVAGGAEGDVVRGMATLASIAPASLVLTPIGALPGWPELTGTGAGELWAFFPDTDPPSVRRLDKATAATAESFDLDLLAGTSPRAWAFAFWGGRWWVFLQTTTDATSRIYRLDPDGVFTEVVSDTGLRIVGAGVSTCAPVDLI